MNSDFSRLLTLLRKEKGISQKNAAIELGVSQALLSHYEKGIRECGLNFVIKAAKFYNVSCDYLLGISPNRHGESISAENLHDPSKDKETMSVKNMQVIYNKKILFCSLNIVFDLLAKAGSKRLINELTSFLSMSIYRVIRILFRIDKTNNDEMFVCPDSLANGKAQAVMSVNECNANAIAKGEFPKSLGFPSTPTMAAINNQVLERNYPEDKSALLNLIKTCEAHLKGI